MRIPDRRPASCAGGERLPWGQSAGSGVPGEERSPAAGASGTARQEPEHLRTPDRTPAATRARTAGSTLRSAARAKRRVLGTPRNPSSQAGNEGARFAAPPEGTGAETVQDGASPSFRQRRTRADPPAPAAGKSGAAPGAPQAPEMRKACGAPAGRARRRAARQRWGSGNIRHPAAQQLPAAPRSAEAPPPRLPDPLDLPVRRRDPAAGSARGCRSSLRSGAGEAR